jgi:hypothetical protein
LLFSFFERERGFFLTGGAALAGFYLHHRETTDLDFFTVNKLTTLVSRSEPRDIVDLMMLERFGCSIDAALPKALEKDGGCTPATLAWVLSQVSIPDGAALPGGVSTAETRAFLAGLVERLVRAAAPSA